MNGILLIAHAPLATALRQCVLHVFPDDAQAIVALDVPANQPPDDTLARAQALLASQPHASYLVLTDVFGATPCNVACKLIEDRCAKLLTGVNMPMVLRAMSYRHEPLEELLNRAMMGGTQGILPVSITAPQHQASRHSHDQDHRHHQQ